MMTRPCCLLVSALGVLVATGAVLPAAASPAVATAGAADLGPVVVERSQVRRFHSAIVGQDYLLKIQLPDGYATSSRRYPVLLLLDGDHHFGTAADVTQMLGYGAHVPPLIIVSPAYGSTRLPQEGGANQRMRDYAFAPERTTPPTGADAFLAFLEQELLPYVDANFRTVAGDRTLWGYSMSARLAVRALLRPPGLFKRYIIVDGMEPNARMLEESYHAAHGELPAVVFLCARRGDTQVKPFADVLQSRNYSGLQLRYAELSEPAHFAVPAEGLARGLKAVFEGDPSLPNPASLAAISDVLLPLAETQGIDAALAKYQELRRTRRDEYRFDLNPLVRALLTRDRAHDALRVAQYNVAEAPINAPGAHVALAEVYRKLGDRAAAIQSYRKALQLNPAAGPAKRGLQELGEPVP